MERTHDGRPSTTLLQPTSTGKDPRSPRRGRRTLGKSRFALIVGTALLIAVGVLAAVLFVTGSVHTLNARSRRLPRRCRCSAPRWAMRAWQRPRRSSAACRSSGSTTGPAGLQRVGRRPRQGESLAVIVSFKALPTDILSGADDATLTHFFDTAPTGHPIYYSYYHEPEDNIADGQFTLADYKAAWARVVALADAARNPDLHSTLILIELGPGQGVLRPGLEVLPARWRHHGSTLGWDAYRLGSATNVNPQPTLPADSTGPCITASESVGSALRIPRNSALSTATGRAAWMTRSATT